MIPTVIYIPGCGACAIQTALLRPEQDTKLMASTTRFLGEVPKNNHEERRNQPGSPIVSTNTPKKIRGRPQRKTNSSKTVDRWREHSADSCPSLKLPARQRSQRQL